MADRIPKRNTGSAMAPPVSTHQPAAPAPRTAPAPPAQERTPFLQGMLAGALLTAIVAGLLFFVVWRPEPAPLTIHAPPTPAPTVAPTPAPLVVYLTGAVATPGLVTLAAHARLADAIAAAGGLAVDADATALNLAQPLVDGMRVHIPHLGEAPAAVPTPPVDTRSTGVAIPVGPINVNTATVEQLITLPGIGETKAQAIVAARPFASVDDLERVPGIGPKTLETLRPLVSAP
jgi:competence protein ComEA